MDESRRCTGTSKQSGKRCKRAAIPGGKVCVMHGGGTKAAKKKAAQNLERQKVESEAQRMVALAGIEQDPIEHLIECLHRAKALEKVWGAMVAELDEYTAEHGDHETRGELGYEERENEKYGGTDIVVTPNDRLLTVDERGRSMVHPYVTELNQAVERRAKFAKMCLDAGVAERQVELFEQQIEIAHGAFEAGLAALDLDEEQKQAARKAYADRLRSA